MDCLSSFHDKHSVNDSVDVKLTDPMTMGHLFIDLPGSLHRTQLTIDSCYSPGNQGLFKQMACSTI